MLLVVLVWVLPRPSMKAPPKRKGNPVPIPDRAPNRKPLNESPSEKEGKSGPV